MRVGIAGFSERWDSAKLLLVLPRLVDEGVSQTSREGLAESGVTQTREEPLYRGLVNVDTTAHINLPTRWLNTSEAGVNRNIV